MVFAAPFVHEWMKKRQATSIGKESDTGTGGGETRAGGATGTEQCDDAQARLRDSYASRSREGETAVREGNSASQVGRAAGDRSV